MCTIACVYPFVSTNEIFLMKIWDFFCTWQHMHKILKAEERNMTHFSLKSLASRGIFTLFPALPSVEIQNVTLSKLEITLKIYPDSKRLANPVLCDEQCAVLTTA